jgi:hypothetical protein
MTRWAAATWPVVPGYIPFALLVVLEMVAVLAWVLVLSPRRSDASDALLLCSRCSRLHERTEAVGRIADAVAVGALAFLVALPFVAAGYESGWTFVNAALAVSAVAAVIVAAAEADFFVRLAFGRLWPAFRGNVEPARIVGGGARWLGALLALYLFQPRSAGIAALGPLGEHLARDLTSTWTITAAALLLAGACLAAIVARWLIPTLFGSLPIPLAAGRERHGSAG